MFKRIIKSIEKSIPVPHRTDIFLITALFFLALSPVVFSLFVRINTKVTQANLYLSPRFEEIFGREITENLISEFNEKDPGLQIRLFLEDEKNAQPEKEPDIIIYDETLYFDYTLLAGLDGYINGDQTNETEDASLDTYPVTAVPLVSFMNMLYYNIDILSAAGFDRPPRTRTEYQTYANTAFEAGFYSDRLEPTVVPLISVKLEDFTQGRAAMIIAPTRYIQYLRQRMGDDAFGITSVPYASDGSTGRYDISLSGIYAGINVNSKYRDEAWSFIQFLLEHSPLFCETLKAIPGVLSDIIPGEYVKNDPFYSKAWDIYEHNRLTAQEATIP